MPNDPQSLPVLKFNENKTFESELHQRVNRYFEAGGKSRTATPGVYIKGLFIGIVYVTVYLFLVLKADQLWEGIAGSVLLGFALVGIGTNIQHDGSHGAFSKRRWINRGMAMTVDFIGASSYFWRWKHNRIHHPFTNVFQFDTDINFGILARMAPAARRYWFHRWQHWYIWAFYVLMVMKWQFFDDFYSFFRGRLGNHRIPRPAGPDLLVFLLGKILFFTYAFVIPLLFHPIGHVVPFYLISTGIAGLTLSMIFVLPHCCEDAVFPLPINNSDTMETPRAIHQVRVTVDFDRWNQVTTSFAGGLNYHREHHPFPGVCHVHYRKIAGIIDRLCDETGVAHKEHRTYFDGLASHYPAGCEAWAARTGSLLR